MKYPGLISNKMLTFDGMRHQVRRWRLLDKSIVFTNGCFDILHEGHLEILSQSAALGDILVVGVNTDNSVKKLKGENRPVNKELFRAKMLAALTIVDAVVLFDEPTPLELIRIIAPDTLVKGGDYAIDQVVGAEDVIKNGGEVKIVPLVKGYSTTALIQKIQEL
ncbi:D-glycero-beta-D-manno-heptose 1-phosphate adenylyltransferase [Agriterribacter sp.]|uniref:D-glycero-beta-D-manno-heptose 1-phosphate adenylyltransferase n=1 Tax=Agriterribacter sp. TaxID=2821509 RepID=UPI002C738630|nr:D-glycero-beta-D-manno-heptose 1-phosphate adenylyltransferase [Agriterribacter sp.]HRO45506.1 D-glycero-beta-D-manno-heptose 1-phosphate adenylyltransferase [Agriterribacter sp.]HRQ19039.1 D-glycero-beta-D-manno-heptose 1-phosphate adenylyltransferase [Agriterribacter sp.]